MQHEEWDNVEDRELMVGMTYAAGGMRELRGYAAGGMGLCIRLMHQGYLGGMGLCIRVMQQEVRGHIFYPTFQIIIYLGVFITYRNTAFDDMLRIRIG